MLIKYSHKPYGLVSLRRGWNNLTVMKGRCVTLEIVVLSFPDVTEQFSEIPQVLFNATATCDNALNNVWL